MKGSLPNIFKLEVIIAAGFFIFFCFYFIPAPNNAIRIHDSFDGNFTTRHVLVKSGYFFDLNPNSIVPGIMNGLPRGVMPRFTDMAAFFMYFFGSLPGFSITFLIVRLIGFLGIYLFGKDHIGIKEEQRGLLVLMAVAFACLPVFIVQGLTVLGVPILLWGFFNLIKNVRIQISLFVFIVFGLWSQLVLVGFHIILILGLLFLFYSFKEKRILWLPLFSIFILAVVYVLADYMLFYLHVFDSGYQSSRGEFQKELGLNFNGVIGNTILYFFRNDYSAAQYFGFLFLPSMVIYFIQLLKKKNRVNEQMGLVFFILLLFCSLAISLLDWQALSFLYKKFSFANSFNFKRFSNVLPALFFIFSLFAITSSSEKKGKLIHLINLITICILFIFIWRGNLSYDNSGFDTTGLKIGGDTKTTFNEFFDSELFSEIKKELGSDTSMNIVHFGMLSSASKYANLNVLDDYQGDYPKVYKQEFRKVIEGELNKSESLKKYFDTWGARCYLESANHFEDKVEVINGLNYESKLSIDSKQLKRMNCKNILSTIIIGNWKELGLRMRRVLVSSRTFKLYFIYQIT